MILGIDLGTSSVKAAAVDEQGEVVAHVSRTYPLDTPRPGWAEQDPGRWWQATAEAVRELWTRVDVGQVRAIGLSGQMHTLVLVDADGRPTRPAISWADARTEEQVRTYHERIARREQVEVLGNPPATGFTGPSLMWVKGHEPRVYRATRWVVLAKDHLRFKLTGEWATDPSDASATLLFDVFSRRWAEGLLERLELDPSLLPPVVPSTDVVAGLTAGAATTLGLREGVPVFAGAGDQAAAACGCGLTRPGAMLITLGSGGQVFAPLDRPLADPQLRVHLFCHAVPDGWHLQGAVQNVGLALDWVRRSFDWDWSELYGRAGRAPAGANGAVFLPYLTGERTPHMDPQARASWSNLTLSHTPDDLARAALEGAIFSVAEAAEACFDAGAEPDTVALTGGGAEHRLARQILSDVLGRAVRRAEVGHASVKGAAVLAGAEMPTFSSVEAEAPGPDADAHRESRERQRRAYTALRDA